VASRRSAWLETAALFAALYVALPLVGLSADRAFGLPAIPSAIRVAGIVLVVVGAAGLAWSIGVLVRVGGGTPNPVAPSGKLVTSGPYAWTRNPIVASHFLAASGVALSLGSPAALAGVFLLAPVPIILVAHEEKTLRARFGNAYREYEARVPRWIPRPPRRQS